MIHLSTLTGLLAGLITFFSLNLFAQSDTVYVRSNQKISIAIGRDRTEFLNGVAVLPNAKKERTITIYKTDVQTFDLLKGKSLLIDVTRNPYEVFEVGYVSNSNMVARNELNKFLSAQRKRNSNLAFEYLEEYKNGFFKDDALMLINAVNAEDQIRQLAGTVQNGNMYLAGELALGLIDNPAISTLSPAVQKQKDDLALAVSKFYSEAGDLAVTAGQYEKAIELYEKADRLATNIPNAIPDVSRGTKIQSARRLNDETRYSGLLKNADSLERINALPETIRTLKKALDIRTSSEISARIERLDLAEQDRLYNQAVQSDKREDFIFYKKKGYYTYLSNYPNGKYVKPSEERIEKLNKEILKVNKITVFWGWGTVSFQDATFMGKSYASMNSVGIGRLTETRFFGLDFAFNQDFFAMNKLEDSGEIELSGTDRIIYANDANGKNGYTSAFQGTASFGVLTYKKNRLKVYGGGSIGWGQLETWVHGYKYSILYDKLPYNITGKRPYHYVVDDAQLNTDVVNASFLLLVSYSNFLLKGTASINQPFVANISLGYAF
jgi:tetratricopeptide (TPR) repeat protein